MISLLHCYLLLFLGDVDEVNAISSSAPLKINSIGGANLDYKSCIPSSIFFLTDVGDFLWIFQIRLKSFAILLTVRAGTLIT